MKAKMVLGFSLLGLLSVTSLMSTRARAQEQETDAEQTQEAVNYQDAEESAAPSEPAEIHLPIRIEYECAVEFSLPSHGSSLVSRSVNICLKLGSQQIQSETVKIPELGRMIFLTRQQSIRGNTLELHVPNMARQTRGDCQTPTVGEVPNEMQFFARGMNYGSMTVPDGIEYFAWDVASGSIACQKVMPGITTLEVCGPPQGASMEWEVPANAPAPAYPATPRR